MMQSNIDPTSDEQDTAQRIAQTWTEFQAALPVLQKQPIRDRVTAMNDLLSAHLPDLAFEISGKDEDEVCELHVTAHGSKEHFAPLMQLVSAAPALANYKVIAFRPRSDSPEFGMRMDGFELSTSDVHAEIFNDGGHIGLNLVFAKEIPSDMIDHAKNMTFIMLDHVLGEYDFAVKVGGVDFVDASAVQAATIPLAEIQAPFDQFWATTLGRSGLFPTQEGDWSSLTANYPATEEQDEYKAAILVCHDANALAGRADLNTLLTLDLPIDGEGMLESARTVQDQIAYQLEQSQTGILAYTKARLGWRLAAYYISDITQARAIAAKVLSAQRTDTYELEHEHDPAWRHYMRVAGPALFSD
jgi:hypothetical protein